MKLTDKRKTDPVTTIVQHQIKDGSEQLFETWSERIQVACGKFEGYMGTQVIRPVVETAAKGDNKYICIFRFDSFANLETWMESDDRTALIEESVNFSVGTPEYDQYHSLEFMFPPDTVGGKPPSREKMAFVTFLGLIPPVYFVPPLVIRHVTEQPLLVTLLSLAVITPLMVYAIMPILTKFAARWIYK